MKRTTVTRGGKRWTVKRQARVKHAGDDCYGLCDSNKRLITIEDKLSGVLELETVLHECRHATGEILDEDFVRDEAREVAAALFKLGYRKLDKSQMKTLGIE